MNEFIAIMSNVTIHQQEMSFSLPECYCEMELIVPSKQFHGRDPVILFTLGFQCANCGSHIFRFDPKQVDRCCDYVFEGFSKWVWNQQHGIFYDYNPDLSGTRTTCNMTGIIHSCPQERRNLNELLKIDPLQAMFPKELIKRPDNKPKLKNPFLHRKAPWKKVL